MPEEPIVILRRMVELRRDAVRAQMRQAAADAISEMAARGLLRSTMTVTHLVNAYVPGMRDIAKAWRDSLQDLHDRGVLLTLPLPREQLLQEAAHFVQSVEQAFRAEIVERLERLSITPLAAPFEALARAGSEELRQFHNLVDILEHSYSRSNEPTAGGRPKNTKDADRVARATAWARNHPLMAWVLIGVAALAVILPLFKIVVELRDRFHRQAGGTTELVVGRIIEGEAYLNQIKLDFEKHFPQFTIRYNPPLGAANERAPIRFERLASDTTVDLFLGGATFLHDRHRAKLADVRPFASGVDGAIPREVKWVGYYSKVLGIVFEETVPQRYRWTPSSFRSLCSLPVDSVGFSPPKSSASRELLMSFATMRGGLKEGKEAYAEFVRGRRHLGEGQLETTKLVALGRLLAGVEWVNDALSITQDPVYRCVFIAVPDEAQLSLSAISIRFHQEPKPGIREFLEFVLSKEAQRMHYEYDGRLPVIPSEAAAALNELVHDGRLTHVPSPPFAVARAWDEMELTNALEEFEASSALYGNPPLDFSGLDEATVKMGCRVRRTK